MKSRQAFDIKSLQHYMFTKNHIMDLCITEYSTNRNKNQNKRQSVDNKVKSKDESFFVPTETDKLFWCYYILMNGLTSYTLLDTKKFIEEKQQKIQLVEKIRNNKDLLKKYKWKKNALETDLVYNKHISIDTFLCICKISNLSVSIIKNNCLYTIDDTCDNIQIIKETSIGYGCYLLEKAELEKKYNDYCATLWKVENIKKPLAAISSYKIATLHDICNKLKLPIKTTDGKKLKKKELYESIKSNI